ncbi:hypothetical protein MtrunA17_Chr2g0293761 [Medicago truncatula]|uniref:Uncharacterized protein n=1 Tax=Medicago truncatula TaxID=3880 RepID=G7IL10_MEDTR|nr:hypothetical protein MTR_2g032870 [Medicago truncatula]RHN72999.1 hypothetical protein MtrunA17_Chr2g0293761 [Medicago truncatula]
MNKFTSETTDETNPVILNLNIVQPPLETNLNSLIAPVSSTPIKPNLQFEFYVMGNMTDINFYISDAKGDKTTDMAFCVAYKAAKDSKNNKELCACVGSMLCSVVPGLRNSVEEALNGIGIRPRFVSLPSQAHENSIVVSDLPQLDWPSILVMFGYCIFLLCKSNFNERMIGYTPYNNYIPTCIRELQAKARFDPSNKLDIPFDATKANAITTMLGSRELGKAVITFLMNYSNHPDSQISNVCKYLNSILSGPNYY